MKGAFAGINNAQFNSNKMHEYKAKIHYGIFTTHYEFGYV
jgi:hypothetical protein